MRFAKTCFRYLKSRNLVTKLRFLYTLLIVVVLILFSLFFYIYYRHTLEIRTIEYAGEILRQSRYNIENNFKQIEQLSMILISNDSLQEYLVSQESDPEKRAVLAKSAEKQCIDVMVSRNDIESISLYMNNGDFIGTGQSYSSEEYEQILLAAQPLRGKLSWIFLTHDSPIIVAARIVYSTKTMQPMGLLVIRYRISSISQIIASQNSNAGQLHLFDTDGKIIAGTSRELTGITTSFSVPPDTYAGHDKQTIGGKRYLVNYLVSAYNHWQYVSFVPESALSVEQNSLLWFIVLAFVFSAFLGFMFSNFIAKSVTRPMQKLVNFLQTKDIKQLPIFTDQYKNEFSILFEAYNDMVQRIDELITINYEQKLLHSEMELKILHMQINPHFLYNTLDTIYYMTLDNHNQELAQIIKMLADMMRYSISGNQSMTSLVANEVHHAENYCAIQKIRLGDKFQFYFDIADEVLNQKLPRLSLQPFLENCILHGYSGNPQQVLCVEVVGLHMGDTCVFEISDDGVGLSEEVAHELECKLISTDFSDVHGIAIPNIHAQLQRLFDARANITFKAHNAYGGATFTITIPFKSTQEGQ